jgi:hypothetical protein
VPEIKKKRLYNTLGSNNKYMKTQENFTVRTKIETPMTPKKLNDKFSFEGKSEKSLKTADVFITERDTKLKQYINKRRQEYKELKSSLKLSDTDILKKIKVNTMNNNNVKQ